MQKRPFDSFMDYAPMPIAILDAGLRFVKVNRAMAEACRTTAKAHLGKTMNEVLPNLSTRILMNISESHAGVSICARGRVTLEVQQLLPFCFVVGQTSK